MNSKYCYIIAILAINTSCYANSDVVEKFEAITDKFSANAIHFPSKIYPPTDEYNQWARRQVHVSNVGYDVKKTNSLVSPFSGEITYQCSVTGMWGDSKEEVTNGPDAFNSSGDLCLATYAFQKNKWIKKNVMCKDDSGWGAPGGVMVDCASALPLSE